MNSLKVLGLLGSSIIEHYPLDLFKEFNIHPIVISTSPKNLEQLTTHRTFNKTITHIKSLKVKLDYMLILIGSNDVGRLKSKEILEKLIYIAETLNNMNITPIIAPLINRKFPRFTTADTYAATKNLVNKKIKMHYRKLKKPRILKLRVLKLEKDGVHLPKSSYNVITRAISVHIQQLNIQQHIFKLPPGHYKDLNNNEEYIIEHITETS